LIDLVATIALAALFANPRYRTLPKPQKAMGLRRFAERGEQCFAQLVLLQQTSKLQPCLQIISSSDSSRLMT
jgi:hypothetical protein